LRLGPLQASFKTSRLCSISSMGKKICYFMDVIV